MVGPALDRDKGEVWVLHEGFDEVIRRDKVGDSREVMVEEGWDRFGIVIQVCKQSRAEEERACEGGALCIPSDSETTFNMP